MRLQALLLILAGMALVVTGCGAIQVEVGFKHPVELTGTAEAKAAPPTPTLEPQLGKLAFVKGGDIWVEELADGLAIQLTEDGRNEAPLWSPSGEWLAFHRGQYLWVMRASGTEARSVDVVQLGLGQSIAWSPNEDRLAYISRGGLFIVNADGTERRELVAPSGREGSGVMRIAWSGNGQWIAFEKLERTDPRPTVQGLWQVKADGTEIKEVYLNPDPFQTQSYLAGWSPDGQSILFWQGREMSASLLADGVPLMWVPVTGGTPTEITKAMLTRGDFLSWSPDNQRLAFVDGGYRSTWYRKGIAVATLARGVQQISDNDQASLFPAWSPNSQWLAFTDAPAVETDGGNDAAQASAKRRIWVMRPDGSDRHPLTSDPNFRDERPLWSADGSFILFPRFRGDQVQLWLMQDDGSEQRQVVDEMTPSPASSGYYGYVDWGRLYDWWRS